MTTPIKCCSTCVHWEEDGVSEADGNMWGYCLKLCDHTVMDTEDDIATVHYFYCNQHVLNQRVLDLDA